MNIIVNMFDCYFWFQFYFIYVFSENQKGNYWNVFACNKEIGQNIFSLIQVEGLQNIFKGTV